MSRAHGAVRVMAGTGASAKLACDVGCGSAVVGSAVVFGDPTYSTELRRGAQEASPALLGTAIVGGAVAVIGVVGMGVGWLLEE